ARVTLGAAIRSVGVGRAGVARSAAKNTRKTPYSTTITTSHGSVMSRANPTKPRPLVAKARRLVRLETGSSSDAELARCVHAYTCGRGRTPTRAVVANTTGVSSTTVASRLSTAVTSAATPKTVPSRA